MTSLPKKPPEKKLGLVIDLDICVGCHACAVHCKEWNTQGYHAPLTDTDPYGKNPDGVWFNRVHTFEVKNDETGRVGRNFERQTVADNLSSSLSHSESGSNRLIASSLRRAACLRQTTRTE